MPIFEFMCKKCNKDFEELCRTKDKKVKCPACGGSNVHKKISSFAVSAGSKSDSFSTAPSSSSGCSSCASKSCSTCH